MVVNHWFLAVLGVLQTDEQTDICECRVAFATENTNTPIDKSNNTLDMNMKWLTDKVSLSQNEHSKNIWPFSTFLYLAGWAAISSGRGESVGVITTSKLNILMIFSQVGLKRER